MSASYDAEGNYQYPDGFDPETNEWLPGHEEAQAEWERQYAEARKRFEAHMKQVEEAKKAEAEAVTETEWRGAVDLLLRDPRGRRHARVRRGARRPAGEAHRQLAD